MLSEHKRIRMTFKRLKARNNSGVKEDSIAFEPTTALTRLVATASGPFCHIFPESVLARKDCPVGRRSSTGIPAIQFPVALCSMLVALRWTHMWYRCAGFTCCINARSAHRIRPPGGGGRTHGRQCQPMSPNACTAGLLHSWPSCRVTYVSVATPAQMLQ